MKKIVTTSLLVTACLCGTLTSCDIERLPNGSMSAEQITGDPRRCLRPAKNLVGSDAPFGRILRRQHDDPWCFY